MALPTASAAAASVPTEPAADVVALTRRLAAADDAAWTEAHARYAPRLFRYLVVAARGDEHVARDALQSAFVRAVRHARVFESEEALWGWFTLLGRHALADARRSSGRWRRMLIRFGVASSVDGQAVAADPLPVLVDEALAALPEAERALLEQKYFDGDSVRDIALAAGASEKAVESRLSRARARLRDHILPRLRS